MNAEGISSIIVGLPPSETEIDQKWEIYGPWARPTEAAGALGVQTRTVRRWAESGFIRYYEDAHGYTYNADDVRRLAELISGYPNPGLWLLKLKLPVDRGRPGT